MFSILRFILIVGVIFYYSPVRQRDDKPGVLDSFLNPKKNEPAPVAAPPPSATDGTGQLGAMWKALPEGARQTVIDKLLTTSGLGAAGIKADTLQPGDRQPIWRGGGEKSL